MFETVVLVAIFTIVFIGLIMAGYIQYYENAPLEDIRKLLKESYIILALMELLFGLFGIISFKVEIVLQFLDWWLFYQASDKYPYIFSMDSFFPVKVIFVTLIKAIISIRTSFNIPFRSLIFPYIMSTVCILPLLFAFSYPYEDSKLAHVVWDKSNDEDILARFVKIIMSERSRNEYLVHLKIQIQRNIASLYRQNKCIRSIVSKSPLFVKNFIVSRASIEEI
ncbi:putative integral membrane protein [Cryptosporidium meleagridis]|uniref:Putative integral membrane protein n=1 Tax=Cryptosporidium meleagridis TaxID=93969 RepID=A0A2P4Z4D3_9CRYT|nr:putative integral membrane protein [Cryptosporidium meleagridis]